MIHWFKCYYVIFFALNNLIKKSSKQRKKYILITNYLSFIDKNRKLKIYKVTKDKISNRWMKNPCQQPRNSPTPQRELSSSDRTSKTTSINLKVSMIRTNPPISNSSRLWSCSTIATSFRDPLLFKQMEEHHRILNKSNCNNSLKKSGSGLRNVTWWTLICPMTLLASLFCSLRHFSISSLSTIESFKYKHPNSSQKGTSCPTNCTRSRPESYNKTIEISNSRIVKDFPSLVVNTIYLWRKSLTHKNANQNSKSNNLERNMIHV